MDAATGLLYVGNGQYCDPSTGRFLTRNVNPDSTNPYVPWNPIGAIVGPLGLLSLFYSRRRKRNKWDTLLIFLVLGGAIAMSMSACGPTPPPTPDNSVPAIPPGTPMPGGPGTVSPNIPSATPTPVTTPIIGACPTPTLWSIGTPTPPTGGLSPDDIKILSLFIAAESTSGWVPDDVSYKKAWALLNKYTFDLLTHPDWSPYKSWKHHQRGITEDAFNIKAPSEIENDEALAMQYDQTELLKWYAKAHAGEWTYITPARFAQIEMVVNKAVWEWARYGSRSPSDPVQGATDFTDAGGLCFSDGGGGADCPGNGDSSRTFNQLGATYLNVRRDKVTMEEWRQKFWPNDSSYVYQVGIDPNFNNDPVYTFTRFKQPDGGWPR